MFTNPAHGAADGQFDLAVKLGYVPGWRNFRQFGMNPTVTSTTQEMWPIGTSRVLPSAANLVQAVSDDAEDDIVAITGTGAWTVQVEGLDANGVEITDTITMRGAVGGFTTKHFLRVNQTFVLTAGTDEVNAGNITFSIVGAAQSYIETLEGQSHSTHYTIPANHSVILTNFGQGTGRMSGNFDLQILSQFKPNITDSSWRTLSDIYLYNQRYADGSSFQLIPSMAEMRQVIVSTTTTQTWGEYGGYLVDNRYLPDEDG